MRWSGTFLHFPPLNLLSNRCPNSPLPLHVRSRVGSVLNVSHARPQLAKDSWVRMKRGVYRGDLAQVVQADEVAQKALVKLIPRLATDDKVHAPLVQCHPAGEPSLTYLWGDC